MRPPIAAIYAALYSWALAAWTVITMMVTVGWQLGPQHGGFNDWPTFLTFMKLTWFAGVIGLVFSIGPYARAKQAFTAAASPGTTLPPPEQNQPTSQSPQPPSAAKGIHGL